MSVDARIRISRKLSAYGQRRKEHEQRERKLRRELQRLAHEARTCEPPMSQDEIARLTGVSQPVISRIVRSEETPNLGAENA